jgi:hypothetical protein
MMCFVLVLGVSSLAFAKTKGKVKVAKVTAEETVEEAKPETIVEKMSEPKDALKDKISLAFNIPSGIASVRFWLTKSMGLDLIAGFGIGLPAGYDLSFSLGGNIVFPLMEEKNFAVYVTPGLLINLMTGSTQALPLVDESTMKIGFAFGAALETEVFLVKDLLSVGGSLGLSLGINVDSTTNKVPNPDVTTSATKFEMGLGSTTGSVMVRIYI